MSTRELYESTISWMKDLLQQTINNFSCAYDATINQYNSQPLFSVSSRELMLLKSVDNSSNYQSRNALAQLCKQLAIMFGYQIVDGAESADVDFYVLSNGEKIGYYISLQEMEMPNIEQAVADGMSQHVVVVAKNNLLNLPPPNNSKYRNYRFKQLTRCITLEKFFEHIAPGEFDIFQEYIGRFNSDAEIMLGLVVSPIPTKSAVQKKREKVIAEFEHFSYKTVLLNVFDPDELDFLSERFQCAEIFRLTDAQFVDSFISSEWYFDLLVSADGEMEQTAIVAGYMKAVEQFLFTLMLSKCEELRFKLKRKNDNKLVVLTKENKSELLTMANNLLKSIDYNYGKSLGRVYIDEAIGNKVQMFLRDFIAHTRNGYFHKDNIYTFDEIKDIRDSAYSAFFLLGSSFLFDIEDVQEVLSS